MLGRQKRQMPAADEIGLARGSICLRDKRHEEGRVECMNS